MFDWREQPIPQEMREIDPIRGTDIGRFFPSSRHVSLSRLRAYRINIDAYAWQKTRREKLSAGSIARATAPEVDPRPAICLATIFSI